MTRTEHKNDVDNNFCNSSFHVIHYCELQWFVRLIQFVNREQNSLKFSP